MSIVLIVFGLPGSGKSFFAERLAKKIKAHYLSSDGIRQREKGPLIYSKDNRFKVYDALLNELNTDVKNQNYIVFDATFYKSELRKRFLEKCKSLGFQVYLIEIKASEETIKKRVSVKRKSSDADFAVYLKIRNEFEEMEEEHLELYSDNMDVETMIEMAIEYAKIT